MSKELEALNNIVKEINAYKLHGLGDKNWMGVQDIMQDVSIIEQALNELERLKKFEKLLKDYKDILETFEKGADNTTHGSTPYITYQVKFTHIVSNVNTYAETSAKVDELFYVNETWRMPNNINIVDFINEKYNVVGGISYVILNNKGML